MRNPKQVFQEIIASYMKCNATVFLKYVNHRLTPVANQ